MPVKLASPMIAATLAVGTPAVQFPDVFQALLDVPLHEVWASATIGISKVATRHDLINAFIRRSV